MNSIIRPILLVEAVSLLVAALLHSGAVTNGPFDQAAIYESSIGVVLLVGLAVTYLRPA